MSQHTPGPLLTIGGALLSGAPAKFAVLDAGLNMTPRYQIGLVSGRYIWPMILGARVIQTCETESDARALLARI